jgi:hypothetical protein
MIACNCGPLQLKYSHCSSRELAAKIINCRQYSDGLHDQGIVFRFPAGATDFSLPYSVQTGCGDHPATYPIYTWGDLPEGKAAGA